MAPTHSKILKVTVSGTGTAASQDCSWFNRTTGEKVKTVLSGDKISVIDCANLVSGYSVGDIIEFAVYGPAYGMTTITISNKLSQEASLSATQQTAPVATSI
jgi:hypothetical protein